MGVRDPHVDLGRFRNEDFDRGASRPRELLWRVVSWLLFEPSCFHAPALKRALLRCFGARVGRGVVVKPSVKITFPWKLHLGPDSWVGEEAWLLNLAPIRVGRSACISQRAFLCTGNHDVGSVAFDLRTAPITICQEAWVGATAFVAPGVRVGRGAVAQAGSIVTRTLPRFQICGGNPCRPTRPRFPRPDGD